MKSTILNLKERVLVVEMPKEYIRYSIYDKSLAFYTKDNKLSDIRGSYKLLCKGSELSEEIAKGFTKMTWINDDPELCKYKNYNTNGNGSLSSALDSFISAIEANGFTWGNAIQNPDKDQSKYRDRCGDFYLGKYQEDYKKWQEAESKTFHPEHCLLFKILK